MLRTATAAAGPETLATRETQDRATKKRDRREESGTLSAGRTRAPKAFRQWRMASTTASRLDIRSAQRRGRPPSSQTARQPSSSEEETIPSDTASQPQSRSLAT